MAVGVGDVAPDFTLPSTAGGTVSLADHRGRPVVLAFYPADDSPVCTTQLRSYDDDLAEFENLDAVVLGISPQTVESHDRFAEKHGFRFPLLADTDKSVGDAYGVLGPVGFYRRSVFVIDGSGVVRYAHRAIAGLRYRPASELVAAVKEAKASSA